MRAQVRIPGHHVAALAATIALFLAAAGCNNDERTDLLGPDAAAADLTGPGSDLPQINLSDLPAELNLSDQQKTGMQAALSSLRQDRQQMRERAGRGRRHGASAPGRADREPPMMTFLESTSKILNADQFLVLARYLSERREAHMSAGAPAGGMRGGFFGRAAKGLGLTAEQQESLRATIESHAAQGRDLWQSLTDGKIQVEQAREQARTIAADLKAEMQRILTAEQWAKVEALRGEMRDRRGDRTPDNADHQGGRRAEFLGRILDLSDEQVTQVKAVAAQALPRRQAVHEQLKSGAIEPEEVPILMWQIQQETSAAIRAVLTPEQAERYDALRDLLPFGPGRGMLGPGRGMGMMPGFGLHTI